MSDDPFSRIVQQLEIRTAELDVARRERDEARRLAIEADWCKDPTAKYADLWAARGWPVPGPETTVLTCPYCDYREVVHAKPSPSDHAPCWSCNTRDYGE